MAGEVLPPALQTQAYAGAVLAAQAVVLSEHRLPYDRTLREATVARLSGPTPLRVQVVLSEAALRRAVPGPEVVADQLVWLLRIMELANVGVQVVPYSAGAFPGMGYAFTCLSFLERQFDDLVAVEQLHRTTWLERDADREPYEHTFLKAQDMALTEQESAKLIVELLEAA